MDHENCMYRTLLTATVMACLSGTLSADVVSVGGSGYLSVSGEFYYDPEPGDEQVAYFDDRIDMDSWDGSAAFDQTSNNRFTNFGATYDVNLQLQAQLVQVGSQQVFQYREGWTTATSGVWDDVQQGNDAYTELVFTVVTDGVTLMTFSGNPGQMGSMVEYAGNAIEVGGGVYDGDELDEVDLFGTYGSSPTLWQLGAGTHTFTISSYVNLQESEDWQPSFDLNFSNQVVPGAGAVFGLCGLGFARRRRSRSLA